MAPSTRPVTAAVRVLGLATERRFTNDHRGLNRATWSTRQAGRMLWGWLITWLRPAGATSVLGADDTVDRRSGRKIRAKGCDREAGRASQKQVIRGFGLKWVSMRLWVPVPWRRRVWALPLLTTLARPADQHGRGRHKTSLDGVRHMLKHVRRWRPGRKLVLVVDGGGRGVAGLGVRPTPGRHGVALALGGRSVSPARPPAARQAWPQTGAGHAPTPLAGRG